MNAFNLQNAIWSAKAVELVATGKSSANVICKSSDTQARVEEFAAGRFAVIFPGTASLADWKTDAQIRKTKWGINGEAVHRGFESAYRSVGSKIYGMIPANSRVRITGHSLGGALATLCADILIDGGCIIDSVYTFGSPRVGNGKFSRAYNERLADRTFRIVNAGDPVPHVPWMLGTYRHVDSLVYLPRAGGIETNFVFAAARDLAVFDESPNPSSEFVSVKAHSISTYIKKLEALA